jgi:hypothetical protein
VLPDLLSGAPLAANLLTAAAAAGVGRLLTERFAASIPAEAAVRDVASLLSQRSALDIAAALWVVAEYARVLGRPVAEGALATMAPPAPMPPVHQMPPQGPAPMQQMAPPAQVPGQPVSGQPISGQPVSGQPVAGQPVAAGMAAGGMPPGGGMAAAGDPNATQLDAGAPGPSQARFASGRATAPVQPNKGRILDDTTPFPVAGPQQGYPPQYQQPGHPQQPGFPPPGGYGPYGQVSPPVKRSKAPWVIGGVVAVLVVAAVVAIVLVGGQTKSCTGANCQTLPTHRPSTPVTPVTTPPTHPSTTPPPPPSQVPLAQVMPKDVDVTTCGPDTNNASLMDNVTTSLACNEGASSTLPGAAVLGYQFSTQQDYATGLNQLNGHTGIHPDTASSTCPPASGHDTGVNTWHRGTDASAPALGKLECFIDQENYNYFIWTDDAELTIEIVKADHGQTFNDVATWWGTNNNNSNGQ